MHRWYAARSRCQNAEHLHADEYLHQVCILIYMYIYIRIPTLRPRHSALFARQWFALVTATVCSACAHGGQADAYSIREPIFSVNDQKLNCTASPLAIACHRSASLPASACAALRDTLLQPRMSIERNWSKLSPRRDNSGSFSVSFLHTLAAVRGMYVETQNETKHSNARNSRTPSSPSGSASAAS